MEKRKSYGFVYLLIGAAFCLAWPWIANKIWPPPEVVKREVGEAMLVGGVRLVAKDALTPEAIEKERLEREAMTPALAGFVGSAMVPAAIEAKVPAAIAAERAARDRANRPSPVLIGAGRGEKPYHLQVLFTTKGGSIQQVKLPDFQQADREGLPVDYPDGSKKPLHLIPGVYVPRTAKVRDQRKIEVPELAPGKLTMPDEQVHHPSYVMYHYESEGDARPSDTLGERLWNVTRNDTTADGNTQIVEFETSLDAPHYVKITKTYTLNRADYHIGLSVALTPLDLPKGEKREKFRYQIDGPKGTPIEGEWYTSVYRQGIVSWGDSRSLALPQEIAQTSGSDRYMGSGSRPIRFTGILLQYFASVLAAEPSNDAIEFVRFTTVSPPAGAEKEKQETFLNDITFRAISKAIAIDAQPVTHAYVLYQGPAKVRLLGQMRGDREVPEATVALYRDDLNLSKLTDAPSPNWLGRFANFIGWTDVVIFFTNVIHWLLGKLSLLVPNLGICVIIITMAVRSLLHPLARRQMIKGKIMQARMEKLAPEFKKLQEKYGDDFLKLSQEKNKLMRENNINPAAQMAGCLPLLAQMPVFMGLYYALQESVFFRLEPLFPNFDYWVPNLAAPDMLLRWGEAIPWINAPGDIGSMLYLGPYLNLLPLVAVGLMLYVQNKMMPKSDDPQVQQTQKIMKFSMIFFALFFYKVAAGLCIYFICSSVWGMIERQLLPKKIEPPPDPPKGPDGKDKGPPKPKGWLARKMEEILEEAQKQQQIRRDQSDRPDRNGAPPPNGPPRRKRRRK